MRVEAHWADGRFETTETDYEIVAFGVAHQAITDGAVVSNVLDDQGVLVASIEVGSDDVTYFNEG